MQTSSHLILACGALAREIIELKRANNWQHISVQCLPPELHNRPTKIPAAVRAKLDELSDQYQSIFVAYADCGTGGDLDRVLDEYGIERIPGAHCYQFYAGTRVFQTLSDAEPGSFYLTDFLVRHFERLVWQGLGLDRHPELQSAYFGNYRKLVYLAQSRMDSLVEQAKAAAERLGLSYEYRYTGFGQLEQSLNEFSVGEAAWQN